ncbi:M20/M25/M40 family metallo-hydrolase [Robertkochia sediminum]|uniref:M20/M25/M40 family metallo-hydrolase n=1 Tax=Robertkochia sediminum TaxID=2785326 RepID=UPI0019342652|nr:M20/M25/M40 family metallo-hydrolase [Robertkochia sediminum]MBL7472399.1 M20/M25/M40 family metallo-hydrolase [Robertkochia sediminum]
MFRNPLFFIACALLSLSLSAQGLSPQEKAIVKSIEQNHEAALKFLERTVNINSGTLNKAGVKAVSALYNEALSEMGFATQWIEMPEAMERAGHLFASRKGAKGKKILLIGHLDTVFEEDSPFQKYTVINDSTATGPGINDMKGGNAIIVYALKALYENGLLENTQITVALTGDEESTGKPLSISRRDLIAAAKESDIALGFETSSGFEYAVVARRGSSGWQLKTTGKRAHSSGIFSENTGAGAIFEASRILHEFYSRLSDVNYLTFNAGAIMGGTNLDLENPSKGTVFGKSNVVPQTAFVSGGLRCISAQQQDSVRAVMKEIVSKNLPQTTAEITFTDSYPSMPPTKGNTALLDLLNEVSKDLNQCEVMAYDPGKRGAADISFVASYVDGLDGLGAMGSYAHTPKETIDLNTFKALTERTAILLYRLLQDE